MSLQNLQIVKSFTRICLFFFTFFVHVTVKAWDVDFSRRQSEIEKARIPASVPQPKKEDGIFSGVSNLFADPATPSADIVILNTPTGFVPETIKVKKGSGYRIHVVNVNEAAKNVSFILDAFGEHHGTFFGKERSFSLNPKIEGIFSFVCPETSKQGRFIVVDDRKPASE